MAHKFLTRKRRAKTARTAAYDSAISGWMARCLGHCNDLACREQNRSLRYGENPHQQAALYKTGAHRPEVTTASCRKTTVSNINDTDAAFELVAELTLRPSPSSNTPTHAVLPLPVICGRRGTWQLQLTLSTHLAALSR